MKGKTFTLSANLDNGISEGSEYIVTPNVQKVLQEIINGYQSGIHSFCIIGTYGTGKSSFLLHLEQELDNDYHGQRKLLNGKNVLGAKKFEFLNIVGDVRSLTEILYDRVRNIVKSDETDVLTLFESYCKSVTKAGKSLLVAIDEFGKVLEHAAKYNPEEELYFFQKLAEFINSPDNDVILLTTLHQNFSAYAGSLNQVQRNEWNKVKGRFSEIVFAEPVEQLLYLAAEQLSGKSKYDISNKGFQRIYRLAVDCKYVSSNLDFNTCAGLYPMDTFAAYAIVKAIQRYGQNERSLFSFLNSNDSLSINKFKPAVNRTYNLADVYDYVTNSFHSYLNDVNSDSTGWSAIGIAIERIEGNDWQSPQDMIDAIRIVKSIGMMNLFGNAGFSMTQLNMAEYASLALSVEYVNVILKRLIELKIIRFAEYRQRLVLFEGTDINIEDEIANAGMIVAKPVNVADELRVYFNNRISPVKAYFYHRGTPRFFEYELLENPELRIPTGDLDGYVQMVFSTSEKIIEDVLRMSSECEEAVIFVCFHNTEELTTHIWNIKKYKYIIEKVLVDKGDRVALKELTRLIAYEKNLLNKSLTDSMFSYNSNLTWVFAGQVQSVRSQRDFNKLLSHVCESVYSKTPVINNELINRHKLSGSITGAKAKFFSALINNFDKVDLGFEPDKFPPEKTIYYSLLKNTGLHSDSGFMDKPSNEEINTLWIACENFLHSTTEKPKKLSELVKILSARPYKIKDGFLEFWLPTYLFLKRQDYSLFGANGQYIPDFNIELLDLMKKHIGEFRVKAYSSDGIKLQLFNQYRKFLNLDENDSIKERAFIDTVKPFIFFYNRQLNDYAKHTSKIAHAETLNFRDVLAHAKDPEKAFLEDLPAALGYDDEKLRDENAVTEYCYLIQRAVRELRGCYSQLIDRIEDDLIERLGLVSVDYSEYVKEIQNRLANVKQYLLTSRQKEFHQHVMSHFDKREEWYQSVCYSVIGTPLDRLRDEQEPKLHDELISLFKECEQNAVLSASLNYRIDEGAEARSADLESKINDLLTGDDNLDIFTLMRILQKKMKK